MDTGQIFMRDENSKVLKGVLLVVKLRMEQILVENLVLNQLEKKSQIYFGLAFGQLGM